MDECISIQASRCNVLSPVVSTAHVSINVELLELGSGDYNIYIKELRQRHPEVIFLRCVHWGVAGPGSCMRPPQPPPPPPRVLKDSGAGSATNKCLERKLSGAEGAKSFFHTMCLYSKYSKFCKEFIFVLKQQEKIFT